MGCGGARGDADRRAALRTAAHVDARRRRPQRLPPGWLRGAHEQEQRAREPRSLDPGAGHVPAAAGLHELDLRETALGEHPPEIVGAVVEDRHLAHALVAKLANWPLEPVPSREAGDDRPVLGADLAHTAQERLGVREIIEEAETEDDVESAFAPRSPSVSCPRTDS